MTDKKKVTANDVLKALARKYREEFFIPEFKDRPVNYEHRIDALMIWLHPSRSKNIECFEIKTRRIDWLKELETPSKSDSIARHCDKIWLVTSTEKVARLEEIPDNWGWMVLRNKRFKIIKKAPKLNPAFDRDFLITVAQYTKDKSKILLDGAYWRGYENGKKFEKGFGASGSLKKDYERCNKELKEYRKKLDKIGDLGGMNLRWESIKNIKEIMQLVKALRNMSRSYSFESLENNLKDVEKCLEELKKKSKEINKKKSDIVKKLKK